MTRPNILLAIADDLSWPHLSAYGCRFVKTPHADRVAREGVLFHNCFTTAPTCTASRGSLIPGWYPWQLEEGCQLWGLLPRQFPVYPDLLEAAGYAIGCTHKGWGPGSLDASGRTRNPAGPAFNERRCVPLTSAMCPNDYGANFELFLQQRAPGQPFCFWYGAKEPHRAYERGSGVRHGKRLEDADVPGYLPDCETVRSDLLDYALEVERFDADLGRMMALLEARHELENTIILVTGDNGFPFPRAKATVYQNGCHVPLAVRWGRGCPSGRTVTDFVSFVDFAPTLLEAAELDSCALGGAGRSFLDLIRSTSSGRLDPSRDHVFTGRERHAFDRPGNVGYPMRSVVTETALYIRNFEPENGIADVDASPTQALMWAGRTDPQLAPYWDRVWGYRPHDELYLAADGPDCLRNVAGEAAHRDQMVRMRDRLLSDLRDQSDPRACGRGWVFDCYPYFGHPHIDIGPVRFPDCQAYQSRYVPAGQPRPAMHAVGEWAHWI